MTKKRPFSTWTWREYMLQLSVVIAGIMVTFIASDLIGRWSKAREVKVVMQMVAEELKINRTELNAICRKLRYDQQGMFMFQQYGMEVDKVPTDSLEKYMFIIGSVQGFVQQTDALEVLKTSGVIPSINDKHLLLKVLGCYRTMDGFRVNVDFYNQRKMDGMNHLFANTSISRINSDDPHEAWTVMMQDPMCSAFIGTAAYNFGEDEFFDELLSAVDKTIAAIDTKYEFE